MNKMRIGMPAVWGFVAGAMCSLAAISMTSEQTMRKIRRKANRTIRSVSDVASDIADMVR